MEEWELSNELRKRFNNIDVIWNGTEWLTLDSRGRPLLDTYYQLKENGEQQHMIYVYFNGKWLETIPEDFHEDENGNWFFNREDE